MKSTPFYYLRPKRVLSFGLGVLMLFTLFVNCQSDKASYSLTDDQFAVLLADLHLAENLAQNGVFQTKDSLAGLFYGEVFQIHKMDSLEIERNIDLLKNDPKKMAVIYEKVLEVLKKKEAKDK